MSDLKLTVKPGTQSRVLERDGVEVIHPNGNRVTVAFNGVIKPGYRKVADLTADEIAALSPEPVADDVEIVIEAERPEVLPPPELATK